MKNGRGSLVASAVSSSSGGESCWTLRWWRLLGSSCSPFHPQGNVLAGGSFLVLSLACGYTSLGDGAGFWGRGVHVVVIVLVFKV